jgi:hypothetical protein
MRQKEEIEEMKEHCKKHALSLAKEQKFGESKTKFDEYKILKWVLKEE